MTQFAITAFLCYNMYIVKVRKKENLPNSLTPLSFNNKGRGVFN